MDWLMLPVEPPCIPLLGNEINRQHEALRWANLVDDREMGLIGKVSKWDDIC